MQEEGHDPLGECSDNRNNYNRSIKKESIQEEEQDPLDECNHNEEGPDPQIICIQEDRHEPLDKYTDNENCNDNPNNKKNLFRRKDKTLLTNE